MKLLLQAIMAILLVSAGCTGQAMQQASPPAQGQASDQSGNQSGPQPYSPEAAAVPPSPQPGPYAGLGFSDLAALETPLQCNVTYIYQGKSFQSALFMKGGSQIRVESVGGSGLSQCGKTISVIAGSKQYVGCENKTVIPSCNWFVSAYNPQAPGRASAFDFSNVPPEQFSCGNWTYDPAMFLTPGTECSMGG